MGFPWSDLLNDFETVRDRYCERVEVALEQRLPLPDVTPQRLNQALRYVCLGGGKRLRAMLVYASGQAFGASLDQLDVAASAVEMMHAFSLVHDDLPAMDDDDLRRGRPTCHKAFDEATAVLAGDAAQSLAFEVLSADSVLNISPARRLKMVNVLAAAAGASGMAGGQSLDMLATGQPVDYTGLSEIHRMKTGALIRASCQLGGLTAESATEEQLLALDRYGLAIGLAFQIVDDILDVTADSDTLGKNGGADLRMGKFTFVTLLGIDRAREECDKLHRQALECIPLLGDNSALLSHLAQFVVNRSY